MKATLKTLAAVAVFAVAGFAPAGRLSAAAASAPVTVKEDATAYTLDNGLVAARVDKSSGDLVSLKYKGVEMLATIYGADGMPDLKIDPPGQNTRGGGGGFNDHQYGFWSHDAMGPRDTGAATATVTIDPAKNGGERGEVSVKGISNGRKMGTGPGSNPQGNLAVDIEIRYALGRGESGVYTYSIWEHQPQYPLAMSTEARFCFKLNDTFDWMLVDENPHRNKLYPKEAHENKYDYTTNQFDHRAFGWASTATKTACFIVNPSMEYMSSGPMKIEFLCHRDTNQVAAPTVLNYWRSSHYGGSSLNIAEGEHWTKTIGPFLIYLNSGSDPQTLWKDALAQVDRESAKWPYAWVKGVDYPSRDQRGTVKGQLALVDPVMPGAKMSRLLVGLAHPAYLPAGPAPGPNANGPRQMVDWQNDAKNYEFWVRGDAQGRFTIPNVRPGKYTLHAIADGVLGEYTQAEITVEAGKTLDLSKITWTPVRHGQQLWEIGVPNRTATEFFKGDDYFHDGMPLLYATLFPNDINYVIGKSDYRKDWYYQHVPHVDQKSIDAQAAWAAERAAAQAAPRAATPPPAPAPVVAGAAPAAGARRGGGAGGLFGPTAVGAATPRTITFDLAKAPAGGTATLRLAICATGSQSLQVAVNGAGAGDAGRLTGDATFGMGNGIQGIWYEREIRFDAKMLKAGTNTITLTVPAGPVTGGIIYDYLRLELDESMRTAANN